MTQSKIIEIIETLKKYYPNAKCSLNFSTPFELAIAVMLSAQCTDERVNKTTPLLFSKYHTPLDYSNAPIEDIEQIIKPCGFYRVKSTNIKKLATDILTIFNGELPSTMENLMKLPGIGRKSANVIMLDAYNNPQGIAVDTHVKRISKRIGLSDEENPDKIELDLLKIIPKQYLKDVNHIFILHGRSICKAQRPNCNNCPINSLCNFFNTEQKWHD
ncbi:MAG: endonuclease III [Clostridia bacterium]|nr:endonuclease III [Clostridia bacterium]